jgi:hypothetical protein
MVLDVREHCIRSQIALDLEKRYPRSFISLNVGNIPAGRAKEQAAAVFLQVVRRRETSEPRQGASQTFRYKVGSELMDKGNLTHQSDSKSIDDPLTPEREKLCSSAPRRILEWKGKRSQAIAEYQAVLSLKNVEDSHNQAERFLRDLASR